jgi:phage terminase small subunit
MGLQEGHVMGLKDVFNVPPVLGDKMQKRLATPVAPLKKQKRLNEREWTFVKELVSGEGAITAKEAAIRAGFNPKTASSIATTLTSPDKAPHIVAAIQEYRAELNAKYNTTFERHMRDLLNIRDAALAAGAFGAAVQAEYRRGQALGTIYIDRKEIRVGTIDSMSREEVQRKLEELKKLYGGPPPKDIIEMSEDEILESVKREQAEEQEKKKSLREEMRNAERARRAALQEAKGKSQDVSYHEDRVEGESGDPGLSDSAAESGEVCDGGVEGGEEGAEGKPESSSDSVSS